MNFRSQNHQISPFRLNIGGDLCFQVISEENCVLIPFEFWGRTNDDISRSNTCFTARTKESSNLHFSDLGNQYLICNPKLQIEASLKLSELQSIYCLSPQTCKAQSLYNLSQEWWGWEANSMNFKSNFGSDILSSCGDGVDENISEKQFELQIDKKLKDRNADYQEEKKGVQVSNQQTHSSTKSCDQQIAWIEQIIDSSSKKSSKRLSNNLKFRNDVVFKTILRCFRKHYIKDFKSFFDYPKNRNQSRLLVSKVREYLITRFGFENEAMRTVFICIIDTKRKYFQIDEDQEQISTMINSIMYNFNIDKMAELIDIVEFSKILKLLKWNTDYFNPIIFS